MTALDILFVAELVPGSRSWQRVAALQRLGHRVTTLSLVPDDASYEMKPGLVDRIRHRLRLPADRVGANRRILALAEEQPFDAAWFERATTITGTTLTRLKQRHPDCRRIWYAEDDMMNPAHRSRHRPRAAMGAAQVLPLFEQKFPMGVCIHAGLLMKVPSWSSL